MAQRTVVNTDKAPQPIGAYSQAIRVDGASQLLYVAGQVAIDINGDLVGEGDIAAQTRQVFQNIRGILESVGAGFSDVTEFTIYLTDKDLIQPYLQARADIYNEIFPGGGYPASTLLVISGLAREEFLLEIKAVAAL